MILTFNVDKDYERLDEFLLLQGISKKLLKDTKLYGHVFINNNEAKMYFNINKDDCIKVEFPKEKSNVIAVKMPLNIVYEDEYLMVIDKPKSLATIPNRMYLTSSLGNGIMYYYKEKGIESSVHFVNRLDKDTSGLLLVAKSRYVHDYYSKDIKQVKRVYHALVEGSVTSGVINAPIAHSDNHATKRVVRIDGKEAITYYEKVKEYDNKTLVKCILKTGRTHQIRVHMAHIGHPLIGDPLYNENDGDFYLDSVEIEFIHAITKEKMVFKKCLDD